MVSTGKVKLVRQETESANPGADGRELRGEATRLQLLDAVMTSVARHGLEGTTISRIAAISGLSRGLISFHFDGKDKLLEAALSEAIIVYEKSWQAGVVAPRIDAVERLHRAIDHDIDFALNNPAILSLWWAAWGETHAKAIYHRLSAVRDARFVSDLVRMFEQAGCKRAEAQTSASLVNACLLGFWLQHHLEGDAGAMNTFRRRGHSLIEALLKR